MATQSVAPPAPAAEEKPKTADVVQTTGDAKAEAANTISAPSVFVNTEPMREEQVENAVKFLSHPKVKGSPVIYRRSFLEKKGLTKEEIDEAFRRVPDPTPTVSSLRADAQLKSVPNAQPQAQVQTLQPVPAAPTSAPAQASITSRFHWSHAFMALGVLAASGAGTAVLVKNVFVPRLKSWVRGVVMEEEEDLKKTSSTPSLAEEAAAAAKAAAAAAADVAKASQEMLNFRTEERRCFEEFRSLLDVQVQEMKSMSNAIRHLEGQSNSSERNFNIEDRRVSVMSSKQPNANGKIEFDSQSVRSTPHASTDPDVAHHPKSYMDIMAMVQRGEKPSNIREIDDLPPNPDQPLPDPRLQPRPKPWEHVQVSTSSGNGLWSQGSSEGLNTKARNNGLVNEVNGDASVPWLQQKNVRIREIENDDEFNTWSYAKPTNERPIQRAWVPPQPPPVAIPEAAAAIRQPKSSIRKERVADDQLVARPSGETDELQRITKISESGGLEINEGSSVSNSSEIQEQEEL